MRANIMKQREVTIENFTHEKTRSQFIQSRRSAGNSSFAYEIGARVRKARVEANVSGRELAQCIKYRATGESPKMGFIYRLEGGLIEAPFYIIEQIAAALGKPITYFGGNND